MAIQKIFVIISYNNLTKANACDLEELLIELGKKAVQGYVILIVEDIEGVINSHFNEAFFHLHSTGRRGEGF